MTHFGSYYIIMKLNPVSKSYQQRVMMHATGHKEASVCNVPICNPSFRMKRFKWRRHTINIVRALIEICTSNQC